MKAMFCRWIQRQPRRTVITRSFLCAAGSLAILQGCTVVPLIYGQLPRLGTSWLDDAFDLSSAQQTAVRQELQKIHTWHSTVEIPKVTVLLSQAETLLTDDGQWSAQDVELLAEEFWTLRDRLFDRVYQSAFFLLITLSPEQKEHFKAFLKKQNEKRFADLAKGPQKFSERFEDRWENRIDDWAGSLSQTQRAVLAREAKEAFARESEHQNRTVAAQEAFHQTIAKMTPQDAPVFAQTLWSITPAVRGTPRHQATLRILTEIASDLSPVQKSHLTHELRKWRERLQGLATPLASPTP